MSNALNIGKNALLVNQAALNVVSNNIANMNTVGYSKQRVNLSTLTDNSLAANAIQQAKLGYGVDIESISRYRDSFVDSYYREALSSKSYFDTLSTNGASLESLANEFSDTGLSSYLNAFYDAANNLSLYPNDITMKTNFVQQAANLATKINNISSQLVDARQNLVGDISNPATIETSQVKIYTDEINQILKDIATVNANVIYQHNTNVGASSGLLDQRDLLIDKLAEYIPVEVTENPNGGINISCGSLELLAGTEVRGEFKVNVGDVNNPAIISFEDDGYVYSSNVQKDLGQFGKLAAILTLGGNSSTEVTIKSMQDNLDLITNEFAAQVNSIQLKYEDGPPAKVSAYYDSATNELKKSNISIFVAEKPGVITAGNISINNSLLADPSKVATALVEVDADGNLIGVDEIGNNKTAQAFVDLRASNIARLDGLTFEDFNTKITTDFGSKLSSAKTNFETQQNVYNSAYEQRESSMGVNMEEELTDLVKFQRAYEASARVFSVADEILQTLVNLAR